jgi:hypothetical protein
MDFFCKQNYGVFELPLPSNVQQRIFFNQQKNRKAGGSGI